MVSLAVRLAPCALLATSFLLVLFTLVLSPRQVPLIHLMGTPATASDLFKREARSWADGWSSHVERRVLKTKVETRDAVRVRSSAQEVDVLPVVMLRRGIEDDEDPLVAHLYIGAMGSCAARPALTGRQTVKCTTPSFTPIFLGSYANLTLSDALIDTLPAQFPLAPSALVLGLILLAVAGLSTALAASATAASEKKKRFLADQTKMLGRMSVLAVLLAVAVLLVVTITWRLQLQDALSDFDAHVRDGDDSLLSKGSLGSAFDQLWSAVTIAAVGGMAQALLVIRA